MTRLSANEDFPLPAVEELRQLGPDGRGDSAACLESRSLSHGWRWILGAALLLWVVPGALQSFAQDGSTGVETNISSRRSPASRAFRNRGELVVAAYAGGAHTTPSSLTISQPTLGTNLSFDPIHFDGQSFVPPIYYGYRLAYFMSRVPSLGVEAELIHLKVFADTQRRVRATGTYRGESINRELPLGQIVQGYSVSHGVNLLLFNLVGRYRVRPDPSHRAGRLLLAGRVGIGPTVPHTESNIDGQAQQQYELGRVGWQLAGGAEIHLWRGLYALGEYKFTRTRQRGKIFSGEAESLLRSHHGVVGLSYHF